MSNHILTRLKSLSRFSKLRVELLSDFGVHFMADIATSYSPMNFGESIVPVYVKFKDDFMDIGKLQYDVTHFEVLPDLSLIGLKHDKSYVFVGSIIHTWFI